MLPNNVNFFIWFRKSHCPRLFVGRCLGHHSTACLGAVAPRVEVPAAPLFGSPMHLVVGSHLHLVFGSRLHIVFGSSLHLYSTSCWVSAAPRVWVAVAPRFWDAAAPRVWVDTAPRVLAPSRLTSQFRHALHQHAIQAALSRRTAPSCSSSEITGHHYQRFRLIKDCYLPWNEGRKRAQLQ